MIAPDGPAARTDLAWRRAALAAAGLAAVALRAAADRRSTTSLVCGLLAVVLAVAFWAIGRARRASAASAGVVGTAAVLGIAVSVAALAVVLVGH